MKARMHVSALMGMLSLVFGCGADPGKVAALPCYAGPWFANGKVVTQSHMYDVRQPLERLEVHDDGITAHISAACNDGTVEATARHGERTGNIRMSCVLQLDNAAPIRVDYEGIGSVYVSAGFVVIEAYGVDGFPASPETPGIFTADALTAMTVRFIGDRKPADSGAVCE